MTHDLHALSLQDSFSLSLRGEAEAISAGLVARAGGPLKVIIEPQRQIETAGRTFLLLSYQVNKSKIMGNGVGATDNQASQ